MIHTLHEPLPRTDVDKIGTSDRQRVLVMGGGGIAPWVVTATLGIVLNLLDKWYHPVGLVGSWEGVQREGDMGLINFANIPKTSLEALFARYEGGTCLWPGRGMLKRDEFIRMRRLQEKIGFIGTAVVGGDGTISGSQALNYSFTPDGQPVANTVACIKTIDADAEGSLSIGFLTSAHEYAKAVQAMMREIEWEKGIGIVWVYGRDNGHLALHAATLAAWENASVITLVPEFPISRKQFLDRVYALKQQYEYVCVVVSEWFAFEGESQVADTTKRDGAGNAKLLWCTDLIQEIITADSRISSLGKYSLRVSEPAILTRSCDPIPADQKLALHAGQAVADVIERGAWGHAVLMQWTFHDGFRPVVYPLWSVHTGNPVTAHSYDTHKLKSTPTYRQHISEQNPRFYEADYSQIEEQKRTHEDLIQRIARGKLVEHNGVFVPDWAIQEETDREKPTLWHGPISKLVRTQEN